MKSGVVMCVSEDDTPDLTHLKNPIFTGCPKSIFFTPLLTFPLLLAFLSRVIFRCVIQVCHLLTHSRIARVWGRFRAGKQY